MAVLGVMLPSATPVSAPIERCLHRRHIRVLGTQVPRVLASASRVAAYVLSLRISSTSLGFHDGSSNEARNAAEQLVGREPSASSCIVYSDVTFVGLVRVAQTVVSTSGPVAAPRGVRSAFRSSNSRSGQDVLWGFLEGGLTGRGEGYHGLRAAGLCPSRRLGRLLWLRGSL